MSLKLIKNIEEYNLELFEKNIGDICEPLFNSTPISFFEYNVVFEDNSRITLSSKPDWAYYFYNSGYYENGLYHKDYRLYNSGFDYWDSSGRNMVISDAKEKFDLDNGFSMIKTGRRNCEFFHFGSAKENENILPFYLKNIDLLTRFVAYFKCEARDAIKYHNDMRVKFTITEEQNREGKLDADKTYFPIRKYYFLLDGKFKNLTPKEMVVCDWILEGKSAEEIAIILENSKRTIETIIDHIKEKLNCYKQTLLITKLHEIGYASISKNNLCHRITS